MENKKKFYRCEKCGNLVLMVENSGAPMTCCGQVMTALQANTTEAAQEKHVPATTLRDCELVVTVGAVLHPMTVEHHISWIAVVQGCSVQIEHLDNVGSPSAKFCIDKGPATVYEYCNLHGLWSVDLH